MQNGYDAEIAWKKAICEYTNSPNYQKKNCPKVAFCGLISNDSKWDNKPNALYARKALNVLRSNPSHAFSSSELWKAIGNADKHHDGQMDVVLALWNKDLRIHKATGDK